MFPNLHIPWRATTFAFGLSAFGTSCLRAEHPRDAQIERPSPPAEASAPAPFADLTGAQEEVIVSGQIDGGDATHIIALPLRHGRLIGFDGESLVESDFPTFPLDQDGTFAMPLARDGRDWLFAVVNKETRSYGDNDETSGQSFLGFLSLAVGPVDALIVFPSSMLKDDIDLGDVEIGGEETFSSKGLTENSESLAMPTERLAERAKVDDVVRQAKRYVVAVLEGDTVPPQQRPSHGWSAQLLSKILDRWSSPDPHDYGASLHPAAPLDAATPVAPDGHARVYVPSLRVRADPDSDTASRLEILWYFYDRSAHGGPAYVPADPKTFLQSVDSYRISWRDARHPSPLRWTDPIENIDFEPHAWSLDPDAASVVTVSYAVAGATYSWRWRAAGP